jgi:hypothetical protein
VICNTFCKKQAHIVVFGVCFLSETKAELTFSQGFTQIVTSFYIRKVGAFPMFQTWARTFSLAKLHHLRSHGYIPKFECESLLDVVPQRSKN